MINAVIFSKDRAMQLGLLLDSIKKNAEGIFSLSVIYTFSSDEFEQGYEKLISETKETGIVWIRESNFKQNVSSALDSVLRYSCFFTDDDVLFGPVSETEMTETLSDENVLCFSMRLGRNTNFCYTMNRENKLLDVEESGNILKFDWSTHGTDYGYPLSVDGHIFRTNEISKMSRGIPFSNPNTYEANLQIFRNHPRRKTAMYMHSVLVGVPANKVQSVFENRSGEQFGFSVSDLNARYLSGERIDLDVMDFSGIRGCHQELEYKFKKA
jgi:hypothetical protein